jgi:hypothetical protein
MKKKKQKVNRRIKLREILLEQGAYDGRFRNRVETTKKKKKVKHKHKLTEDE